MSRRRLKPEELELWRQVAQSTQRLHPEKKITTDPALRPAPKAPKKDAPQPLPAFRIGEKQTGRKAGHDALPGVSDRLANAPVKMDSKSFTRLKRGKLYPEDRIDLHGMTVAEAHPALVSFVLGAHAAGKRLVLVITGKGRSGEDHGPIPQRRGVLKHHVPHWLSMPPLSAVTLQVSEAHLKHGGTGAYYVYLRRGR